MEYINKTALVAEIERRIKEHHSGYLVCLKDMLSFVDTLEVKEVQEEPVSEELEEAAVEYCGGNKGSDARVRAGFLAGAKWQKENLWKPADGDDLPEIDREVIALKGIVDPTATDCFCGYEVIFAHRPDTKGYDGKSITTGETKHYTPKTYGEGGWNIPNVVYWLDVELPKEIEL